MKKNNKKKLLRTVIFLLILTAGIISVPDQYQDVYSRVIVRQYDYYREIEENKIVFIGTSSMSYGLDIDLMEKLTGMTCAVLGNNNMFGRAYPIEISKCNLKAGDTVVLEVNPNQLMDTNDQDAFFAAIGKRYDMYKFFLRTERWKNIKYFPAYWKKNCAYWLRGGVSC